MRVASQVPRCNKLPRRTLAILVLAWSLPKLSVSQVPEPSFYKAKLVWPRGIDLEWHLPYSCAHHGFVTELLGYLPALQRLVESGNSVHKEAEHSRVLVTGLGPCSNTTLAEFAPLERAALLHALAGPDSANEAVAAHGLRYCRMEKQDDGETFAQICDRPRSDLDESDSSNSNTAFSSSQDSGSSNRESKPPTASLRPQNRRVVVTHGEPCALKARDHFPTALAVVGRTMTETSTLSVKQRACLRLAAADEFWIPTPWGAQVLLDDLKRNEVLSNPAAIAVVPETVDGIFLDPALVEHALYDPDAAALERPTKLWRYGGTPEKSAPDNAAAEEARSATNTFRVGDSSDCGLLRGHETRKRFVVVSVFKWGHRKGWDVLLEAYWRAFLDPKLATDNAEQGPLETTSSSVVGNSSSSSGMSAQSAALPPAAEVVLCLRTSKPKIGFTGEVFESKFGSKASNGNSNSNKNHDNSNDENDAGGVGSEIRAYARHFLRRFKPPPPLPPPAAPAAAGSNEPSAAAGAEGVGTEGAGTPAATQPSFISRLKSLHDLPAVEVHGQPLSKVALRALVGRADAFALPHRGEGWALPLTEAMALGVPVIATNHSGPSFYLTNNNSWPIPLAFEHADGSGEPSVMALVESLQSLYIEWRNARVSSQDGGSSSGSESKSSNGKSNGSSSSTKSGSSSGGGIVNGSPVEEETFAAAVPLREAPPRAGAAGARGAQARLDVVERFSGDEVAALMVQRLSALAQIALK